MNQYFCNPINIRYHYQFNRNDRGGRVQIDREAADPSMILFQGRYYIFPSMNLSVWVSDDLVHWESHRLPDTLPLYDYAPDVRVMGDTVYFCASNKDHPCSYFRTKDILRGPYEEIPGTFPFWDPNMFVDDDGRVYFYWGCSAMTPIYGVALDPETMRPIGEPKELIWSDPFNHGYERCGEDHCDAPKTDEEIEENYRQFLKKQGLDEANIPAQYIPMIKGMGSNRPYIEGAWMDKHDGRYYLQYACNGAQWNVYADGVYVSDHPLGPFAPAKNNPYSYKPGGFLPGAGHGSTMTDKVGNVWHTSTMRISVHHSFERRVGIWPAGWDQDGELFCNQRYGDWPIRVADGRIDPWAAPEWYLLSKGKTMTASSWCKGHEPSFSVDENVRTWWRAASTSDGEWLQMDLGKPYDVRAVQINFADDVIDIPIPGEVIENSQARFIDDALYPTRWTLTGSRDSENWFIIEDRSQAETDLSHDFIVRADGFQARYLKLTIHSVPYDQQPCVSGLRVFGKGDGAAPKTPQYQAERLNDLDFQVHIDHFQGALGHVILWGHAPDKLYHSCMTFEAQRRIGALVKGQDYWVRVDAFNENGISEGNVKKL